MSLVNEICAETGRERESVCNEYGLEAIDEGYTSREKQRGRPVVAERTTALL